MKKILILTLTVFILLPGIILARQVPDGNLQNCIAAAAGKSYDSLSDKDFSAITILSCEQQEIESLAGIEKLTNLVELSLTDNQVTDISPLAGLGQLIKLYLWHNRINDISPLTGLKQLKELYLTGNQIEDISPLNTLKLLEELLIGDNHIIDIGPLSKLTRLDQLEIFNNQITDIKPLKGMKMLEHLDASGNTISDIDPLGRLGGLNRLFLNGNNIVDIKALTGLKSLKTLFLASNQVNDISPLSNLTDLKILNLSSNRIEDLDALRNLTSLKRLTLDNNLISNVQPLAGLAQLAHVSLLNNCIKNIADVRHVENVTGMNFQHNSCTSPTIVKRSITQEWLNEQSAIQCVEYGENDYSLRSDYDYYPDGIYYLYNSKDDRGSITKKMTCHLAWNSSVDDFLLALVKIKSPKKNYDMYEDGNNQIYVHEGKVKGYTSRYRRPDGFLDIVKELKEFGMTYQIKQSNSGQHMLYLPQDDGYVIQVVKDGVFQIAQYFEKDFFYSEILED